MKVKLQRFKYVDNVAVMAALLFVFAFTKLSAQATFTAGTYSQNFGNTTDVGFPYAASGSWVDNSYYPGWYIYENTGSFQGVVNITNAAPTNTGGTYMYTLNGGTNLLLGTRPADVSVGGGSGDTSNEDGTVNPYGMALGLCLQNNTGATIQSISVQYDWYQLSEAEDGGQDNTNWFDYLQSNAVPSLTAAGFTNVPSMNYTGPNVNGACCTAQKLGLPGTVSTHFNNCISVTVPAGQYITFRWWDPNDIHDDPHFAIDNIQISVATVSVTAVSPTVCSGTGDLLTASGSCTSYTWAPNTNLSATTGLSVTATPTAATSYTVTGTLTGCGTATATVSVGVNPATTLTVTPASASLCPTGTAALTATGASTYTWIPNTSISATTGASVTANPASTITYTVNGTTAAGCAATQQTAVVTVNPTPTLVPVATTPTICTGGSTAINVTGANTYTWTPSATLSASTGSSVTAMPGSTITYTVNGTSLAGCVATSQTVAVTVNTTPTLTASASPTVICSAATTTLTASGTGVGGTYVWSPNTALSSTSGSSVTASPSSTITYSVDGSSAAGCPAAEQTVVVNVNATPTITPSATAGAICAGNSDILNASGAATYLWQPGALTGSTISVSPTATTIYTVTGTSAQGCISAQQFILVTVNPTPTITAAATPTVICSGNSTVLSATNAVTYFWSTGVTGSSISVSPTVTSTYTVTGTSLLGCNSAPLTVPVLVNPTPTISVISPPATICSGNSTTLTASGASTYTWSPAIGATTSTVSVSPSSNQVYTVTGTSAAGCPAVGSATVSVTVNITPTVTVTSPPPTICSGNSTVLAASGASTYTWAPAVAATTSTVSVSPGSSQTYSVSGTSVLGCPSASSATVAVTVNITPTVTITSAPPTICSGNSTVITASGADTYTWSPGIAATTSTVSVSPASNQTYTVSGTSVLGCPSASSATVAVTVNITPTVAITSPPATICSGNATIITATGASTYSWSPAIAATTSTVSVSPGSSQTYTVSGTSVLGCPSASSATVAVNVNTTPTVVITSSPPTICSGNSTVITASGANTYSWAPAIAATTSTVSVSPGSSQTYSVSGTSALGCPSASSATVAVTVNITPTVAITSPPPTICSGNSTVITASGADTYTWSPGIAATTSTVSVSPGSSQTYTVSGASIPGCPSASSATVAVTVNVTPTVTITSPPPTICSGSSTIITASGASTYTWAPAIAATTSTISVSPGSTETYTVSGTSVAACPSASSATVAVTVNITPTLSISGPATICSDSSTTLTGGGASTYVWTPNTALNSSTGATVIASPIVTTTYTLNGSSAAGCPAANPQTVLINVNTTPILTVSPISPAICPGGNVNLIVNSTVSGTTYTWSPSTALNSTTGSTVNSTPVVPVTYTVTGIAVGCPATPVTESVAIATSLTVTVTPATPGICYGDSIVLNAGGASTFLWSPNTGLTCTTCPNPKAGPTDTTTYKVVGSSGSCADSTTVTLNVNPNPTVSITLTGISAAICPGDSMGMIGNGAVSYVWSPINGLNCASCDTTNASPALTTTYTVTGSYATGCFSTATQVLVVYPVPTMTLNTTAATICSGDSVKLSASGLSSYTWTPVAGLNTTIGSTVVAGPASNTNYIVTGTGVGGCKTKDSALVTVNITPTISVTPPVPVICSGDSISLTAGGAATYQWLPATAINCTTCTSVYTNPNTTATYTVVGTSLLGCNDTASITVMVNPTPTITVIASNGTTICSIGDTTLLTAHGGGAIYTWSPAIGLGSTTGTSVSAFPSTTTTYTISSALATGCASTDSIIITVNPTPTITAIATVPNICSGASTTLTASGANTYSWQPGGLTGSTVSVSPTSTTTYTITGIALNGCADTGTVVLTVTPTPTVTISSAGLSVCPGDSILLTGVGATTYSWSTGLTADSIYVQPASATTYTVTGNNGSCTGPGSIVISVNGLTVVGTPVKSTLCVGDSTTINVSGAASYTWLPAAGLSATTGNAVTAKPTSTTTYTITGSSGAGCTNTTQVIITVNPVPVVAASSTAAVICTNGSAATLSATGATSYTWSPATGLNPSTGSPVTANPGTSITYTVTGSFASGCFDTATVSVAVLSPPAVSIKASVNDSLCNGLSTILTASGAASYVWSTTPAQTTSSITVTPNSSITYTVTGYNGTCSAKDSVSVYVYAQFAVTPQVIPVCSSSSTIANAIATGGIQPYTYSWSSGLGTNQTVNINVTPGPVTYICDVTNGCGQTLPDTVVVIGSQSPNPTFTANPDTVMAGQFVGFVNSNSNASNWLWSMGDGNTSTADSSLLYQYSAPGTYFITLVVSNKYGCTDSSTDEIIVTQGIYIPNVFTPNGDGQNDVFHITAGGMKAYSIEIFNRWGEKIFISNSLQIDWDGTSLSGIQESDGVYYYIINLTDYTGKTYIYKGSIQLIRN